MTAVHHPSTARSHAPSAATDPTSGPPSSMPWGRVDDCFQNSGGVSSPPSPTKTSQEPRACDIMGPRVTLRR